MSLLHCDLLSIILSLNRWVFALHTVVHKSNIYIYIYIPLQILGILKRQVLLDPSPAELKFHASTNVKAGMDIDNCTLGNST